MIKQLFFPVVIIIIHCEEIYVPCVNKIQCCIVKLIKSIYGLISPTLTCAELHCSFRYHQHAISLSSCEKVTKCKDKIKQRQPLSFSRRSWTARTFPLGLYNCIQIYIYIYINWYMFICLYMFMYSFGGGVKIPRD